MTADRIERLVKLVEDSPDDPRARYFLAHELQRAGRFDDAATNWARYLELEPDDEGAGWREHGRCLERLGRVEEARAAYRGGIDAAARHRHADLAEEISEMLERL